METINHFQKFYQVLELSLLSENLTNEGINVIGVKLFTLRHKMKLLISFLLLALISCTDLLKELGNQYDYIKDKFLADDNIARAIIELDRSQYAKTGVITQVPEELLRQLVKIYNTVQEIKREGDYRILWEWVADLSSKRLQRLVFTSWSYLDLFDLLKCLVKIDQNPYVFKGSMEKALTAANSIYEMHRDENLSLIITDMKSSLTNLNTSYIQYLKQHDEY